MKRTVKVTIEKEFEIELTPAMFGNMSVEEYMNEWRKSLDSTAESVDDIFECAARMAAYYGDGEFDGLGLLGPSYSTYPRVPDVKHTELSDECEVEFI